MKARVKIFQNGKKINMLRKKTPRIIIELLFTIPGLLVLPLLISPSMWPFVLCRGNQYIRVITAENGQMVQRMSYRDVERRRVTGVQYALP